MIHGSIRRWLSASLAALWAVPALAQDVGTIGGRVTAQGTAVPDANVQVRTDAGVTAGATQTSATGEFRVGCRQLPNGVVIGQDRDGFLERLQIIG